MWQDVKTLTTWDPVNNAMHCALRDSCYIIIDVPKFFRYTNSNYAAMRRFIRQSRRNKGKVNPEDFKDVDTNVLRESMIKYSQFKGPLRNIDLRWFYWMYIIMFGFVCWQAWGLQSMIDAKLDKSGSSLEERSKMFDDDYLEDVRPR